MTVLLFGASGRLGRDLLSLAPSHQLAIVGLDRRGADVTNAAEVVAAIARVKPAVVVNAAAFTDVDAAELQPELATVNAIGPAIIARACADAGLPLIHISTDYVFDGAKAEPYREDDPAQPLSIYGRSKWQGEQAVREVLPEHLILRTAWLFGAHGKCFVRTILHSAAEEDVIRAVTDQRGSPTATEDVATAILLACSAIARGQGVWGTFHVAGTGVATRYELAAAVIEAQARYTGRRPKLEPALSRDFPSEAVRPANSALDSSRFESVYGFRAGEWRAAVDRTVARILAEDA